MTTFVRFSTILCNFICTFAATNHFTCFEHEEVPFDHTPRHCCPRTLCHPRLPGHREARAARRYNPAYSDAGRRTPPPHHHDRRTPARAGRGRLAALRPALGGPRRVHPLLARCPRCRPSSGRGKGLPRRPRGLRPERDGSRPAGHTAHGRIRRHAGGHLPHQGAGARTHHPGRIFRREVHNRRRILPAHHERRGLHPVNALWFGTRLFPRPVDGTVQPDLRRSGPRFAQPDHGLLRKQQLLWATTSNRN